MHPDMMLELVNQRMAEARRHAAEVRIALVARKLQRAQRELAKDSRRYTVPEIPDYVDTMFTETGQAPERRAA